MKKIIEKDWKLFRSKISDWQENYMDKLNKEYMELLSGDEQPSVKFWELHKRINADKKRAGVHLNISRSEMFYNIIALLREGAITIEDINEFSDELKNDIQFLFSITDHRDCIE